MVGMYATYPGRRVSYPPWEAGYLHTMGGAGYLHTMGRQAYTPPGIQQGAYTPPGIQQGAPIPPGYLRERDPLRIVLTYKP